MHKYLLSIINVWTKYGEPRLCGNGETDLIMKKKFLKIFWKLYDLFGIHSWQVTKLLSCFFNWIFFICAVKEKRFKVSMSDTVCGGGHWC
jgi:hypothetical protein